MNCMKARKQQKPRMSREDKRVLAELERRYRKLRMTMGHKEAIEQLKKEAQDAELIRENTEDNGAVHEVGSDVVEERKD